MEKLVKYSVINGAALSFTFCTVCTEAVTSPIRTIAEKEIQVRGIEDGSLHQELTDKLRSAFQNREMKWSIHLNNVGMDQRYTEFRILFRENPSLKDVLGEGAFLQVEVFDVFNASGQKLDGFTTGEMPVATSVSVVSMTEQFVDNTGNAAIHQIIRQGKKQAISAKMNLILIYKSYDKMGGCKRMLEEELLTDAVILPDNGAEVKCHRIFLACHSDVFRAMFVTDMEEAKTRRIEMPDMSEGGVRAFLAYLYHWDTSKAEESCDVALELLKAGHKYNVGILEEAMRKLLLSKSESWFELDVAVKLFLFVRNLEAEWESLRKKAVMVIKKNMGSLENSSTFKDLFERDPKAAMDLHRYTLSVLN